MTTLWEQSGKHSITSPFPMVLGKIYYLLMTYFYSKTPTYHFYVDSCFGEPFLFFLTKQNKVGPESEECSTSVPPKVTS